MTVQQRKRGDKTPLQQTIMALAVSPDVAHDGTLFGVTNEGVLWTSHDRGESWGRVALPGSGMAMTVAVSATYDTDGLIWVSLPEGTIVWSSDRGKSWRDTYLTRTASAASVLAPSPSLQNDNLVLAATLDDGVLRSLDRGRTWSPANFGLLDLKTLAICLAPNFSAEQIALVATESALYRSRNGGLSWKEVGFWENAVQSLVFSPGFAQDHKAWAGTESGGMMASADGGLTWHIIDAFPQVSINVLAAVSLPETWLLAGTVQGVYASSDLGVTWQVALPDVNVLTLSAGGQGNATRLFAATESDGLYVSAAKPDEWTKV